VHQFHLLNSLRNVVNYIVTIYSSSYLFIYFLRHKGKISTNKTFKTNTDFVFVFSLSFYKCYTLIYNDDNDNVMMMMVMHLLKYV